MADTYANTIPVTKTWLDLTTVYSSMASNTAWVQNRGPGKIAVAYTIANTAPNDGGVIMDKLDIVSDIGAHVWVKTINSNTGIVAVGVAN